MTKGKIIVISGPSGVGKNHIISEFIDIADLNLAQSISMTSREKRSGERDGIDYDFVSRDYFESAIRMGDLVEYTEFLGNYYGTPVDNVNRLRNLGKNVLIEVEAKGAKAIKEKYPDSITIFIAPSSLESLEKQIRERREESEEIVQERLAKAKKELNLIGHYKFVVNNEDARLAGELCALIIRRMI
ncbi:MAG: guanylate kinase [Erysipelotrichales bacterium]|nr:guanylate kinase [Erysipelotrichales bacterium]MBR3693860.1 guanylate kinase [Erysipelotrichales bacterium]